MKFFDTLKMAIHNLWNNKSRTALTIVIVFVVSSLIMAMCLLGTNFMSNQARANVVVLDSSKTQYNLGAKNLGNWKGDVGDNDGESDAAELETISGIALKHKSVVDTVYVKDNVQMEMDGGRNRINANVFSPNFPYSNRLGAILNGRIWTAADAKTNNVWLTSKAAENMSKVGKDCSVGATLAGQICGEAKKAQRSDSERPDFFIKKDFSAVVAGIIQNDEDIKIFIPLNNVADMDLSFRAYGVYLGYEAPRGAYNYDEVEKEMNVFTNEVNSTLGKGVDYNGKAYARFSSEFLDNMKMGKYLGIGVIALFAILSFIILLLSIGSVANTITMSVDKNKKFIGLMKAMGLRHNGVKGIVYLEATIQIIIGVALGVLFVFCIQGALLKLLQTMLGAIFMMTLGTIEFKYTFTIAFYIPLITIAVFVGMALLFSKGAMTRMGKMDVISIISEAG